jgi:diaminohydroxyphosphoribosylaminopyrimidine deaminase / 5-amino-6-(5-phosphoribosylamino)uracil reductase
MQRCIELAAKGLRNVAPNPMVGAVIVHNDCIIGEGYHHQYGGPHAEVVAIKSVKQPELLKESILYVSLEPCAHYGKTPPCSDLIIDIGIPTIVIGCIDPYSEVAGKGVEKLKNAGREVITGVLETECLALNKRFFTFHTKKRPYIILKWAQTADGFIDRIRTDDQAIINWITSGYTQQLTHLWRSQEQAILIGKNTVINDNPTLTCRAVNGKNPLRVVIDKNSRLQLTDFDIFNNDSSTWVITETKEDKLGNITYCKINFSLFFQELMHFFYTQNIQSVIIEGGGFTLQSFIDNNLWDEARILSNSTQFALGVTAPQLDGKLIDRFNFGNDTVSYYRNV